MCLLFGSPTCTCFGSAKTVSIKRTAPCSVLEDVPESSGVVQSGGFHQLLTQIPAQAHPFCGNTSGRDCQFNGNNRAGEQSYLSPSYNLMSGELQFDAFKTYT